MNIPFETLVYAEKLGLEAWSTGGGFDFVGCIDRESGICFQISDKELERADDLDNPAELFIYDGYDFESPLILEFPSMRNAMDLVANFDFRVVALQHLAEKISPACPKRAARIRNFSEISEELAIKISGRNLDQVILSDFGVSSISYSLLDKVDELDEVEVI